MFRKKVKGGNRRNKINNDKILADDVYYYQI